MSFRSIAYVPALAHTHSRNDESTHPSINSHGDGLVELVHSQHRRRAELHVPTSSLVTLNVACVCVRVRVRVCVYTSVDVPELIDGSGLEVSGIGLTRLVELQSNVCIESNAA